MKKSQAIHSFWSSFGLVAIPVPLSKEIEDDIGYPYITYTVSEAAIDEPVAMQGDLWFRSNDWKEAELLSYRIADFIKMMNPIKIDDGYITIVGGTPFSQRLSEPDDDMIRRLSLNIIVEYFTNT